MCAPSTGGDETASLDGRHGHPDRPRVERAEDRQAILVFFSPEFATRLGVTGPVSAGDAVAFFYGGLVLGDVTSGVLSQLLHSRKKVVLLFVRGLVALVTTSFRWLRPQLGLVGGALAVGAVRFVLALVSAFRLRETFGVDLDYLEPE